MRTAQYALGTMIALALGACAPTDGTAHVSASPFAVQSTQDSQDLATMYAAARARGESAPDAQTWLDRARARFETAAPTVEQAREGQVVQGIAAAAIFSFVVSWNEFFYALVLTRDHAVTLPLALMSARTEQGDAWDIMASMGLFIIAPMLLISRFVQRYFVKGLVSGAVR